MLAVRFQTPSAQLRSCCHRNNMRTPAPDAPREDQAAVAKRALRECGLFRGVPLRPRVYAASSFPIANSARARERSLDPIRRLVDKAVRSVLVLPGPPKHRKDHALARKPDKLRRFPLAFASSAISLREIASLAARWRFRGRDRSGLQKRRLRRGRNRWPRRARRCWRRLTAR